MLRIRICSAEKADGLAAEIRAANGELARAGADRDGVLGKQRVLRAGLDDRITRAMLEMDGVMLSEELKEQYPQQAIDIRTMKKALISR